MPYLADTGFLLIKPEATDGTAVIPTIAVPLVSENLKTVVNHKQDDRMKGVNWSSTDILRGNRQIEGEITVLADSTILAHLFNNLYTKGSTTGSATGYTHPFTVGSPDSYTIEVKRGLYAQRYFGVKIDELKLSFDDGRMVATLSVKAKGQVGVAKLGVALTGAGMTSMTFADDYDTEPTRGLVANDVVNIGGTDLTVLTVTSTGVTFASTSLTFSVGEPIYLKPQTATIPTLPEPFMIGQVVAGFGVDATAATTAAGSRTTSTPIYDIELTFKNNLFVENGSQRHEPTNIYPQRPEAQIKLTQLMESENQQANFLNRTKQALVLIITGRYIDASAGTRNKATFTFNNVKLMENANQLTAGSLIVDQQVFEAVYDATDGQAVAVSIINPSAGTNY